LIEKSIAAQSIIISAVSFIVLSCSELREIKTDHNIKVPELEFPILGILHKYPRDALHLAKYKNIEKYDFYRKKGQPVPPSIIDVFICDVWRFVHGRKIISAKSAIVHRKEVRKAIIFMIEAGWWEIYSNHGCYRPWIHWHYVSNLSKEDIDCLSMEVEQYLKKYGLRDFVDLNLNGIVKYDNGDTALHLAIKRRKYHIAKYLIERTKNINDQNEKGHTPLMTAVIHASEEMVRIVLESGARVKIKDNNGWTALYHAAAGINPEEVKLLIKYGADVDSENKNGFSIIHAAAMMGSDEVLKLIIDNGGDIERKEVESKMTPLFAAIETNKILNVKLLVSKGANVNVKEYFGMTTIEYAKSMGRNEIVKILEGK